MTVRVEDDLKTQTTDSVSETASDDEVLSLSEKLMTVNDEVYKELAK